MQPILQRTIGLICLVIGVLLLVHGRDIARSLGEQLGDQMRQVIPMAPSHRSTYFYIAGAALAIFGVSQIIWPAKPK